MKLKLEKVTLFTLLYIFKKTHYMITNMIFEKYIKKYCKLILFIEKRHYGERSRSEKYNFKGNK